MQTADYETQRGRINTLNPVILTRTPKAVETARKVIDLGALTVEEVKTAKGEYAYKPIARSQKRMYANDLLKVYEQVQAELLRLGMLVPKTTIKYDKYKGTRSAYYYSHHEEIKAQMKERAYKKYHKLD